MLESSMTEFLSWFATKSNHRGLGNDQFRHYQNKLDTGTQAAETKQKFSNP
jgi:hypothetical protein